MDGHRHRQADRHVWIDRQRDTVSQLATDGRTDGWADIESDDSLHMPSVRHGTVGGNIVTGLLVELVAGIRILSHSYTLLVNVCFLIKLLPRYLFGNTSHHTHYSPLLCHLIVPSWQ